MTTVTRVALPLPAMNLTENQLKVIKDKYLRDAPSPEAWLEGVASNIALGELLHLGKEEEIFAGVDVLIQQTDVGQGEHSRMFLLHHNKSRSDERRKNFEIFLKNLQKLAEEDPECKAIHQQVKDRFYKLMASFDFLPNSPTLMNAGRPLQQLSACYVLPIEDSVEGWMDAVKNAAIIHKSGGGTGFSSCRVRSKGSEVRSTKGVASGALSPFMLIDAMTQQVKQGGTRRGANMGILPYNHPDILDFIEIKRTPGVLENFNISVAITEDFMKAVEKNENYDLIDPHTKKSVGQLNASEMWEKLVKSAWETGDPGLIMIDRINNTDSNPTPHIGLIESTNPCGEQPLLPYEPCNLGSINLSNFVLGDGSDMDWKRLRECVHTCVRFLDNVIDVNNYPLSEIELLSKSNRRIGLGVMGWAEALVLLKLPYNSKKGFTKAEQTMKFINDEALRASEELARVRGTFPNWKNSIFDPDGAHFRGVAARPRHCARTTIAPTGTIGITAGLQGAGIEPFFAVVYTRYNAKALDAVKKGEKPRDADVFYEINPLFEKIAQQHSYFGMKPEELWTKVEQNHKSLVGISEIPGEIQELFLTSHDLIPEDHVHMQAAFQKHTNNAVSKTINFKNEATIAEVNHAYKLAFSLGCKGITIYRDGSKQTQVLNLTAKQETPKKVEAPVEIVPEEMMQKIILTTAPQRPMSKYEIMQSGSCPDCKGQIKVGEGCYTCMSCGFSACSV